MELNDDNLDDFMNFLLDGAKKLEQQMKKEAKFREDVHTSSLFLDNKLDIVMPAHRPLSQAEKDYVAQESLKAKNIMRLYDMLEAGKISAKDIQDVLSTKEGDIGWIKLDDLAQVADILEMNNVLEKYIEPEAQAESTEPAGEPAGQFKENLSLTESIAVEGFFQKELPAITRKSIGWNVKSRFGL